MKALCLLLLKQMLASHVYKTYRGGVIACQAFRVNLLFSFLNSAFGRYEDVLKTCFIRIVKANITQ